MEGGKCLPLFLSKRHKYMAAADSRQGPASVTLACCLYENQV